MAAQIKTLTTQRGKIKRILTTHENVLKTIVEGDQTADIDAEGRLKKIEETWDKFDKILDQLEELQPGDEKKHEEERSSYETRYFALTGILKRIIREQERTNSRESSVETVLLPTTNANQNAIISNIKLPTINLPTFNGSYETWLGFSDTFKSIVHDNDTIPATQKLHYLKSCLNNEASEIIHSLEISAENYTVAWDLLSNRYDNKKVIIESHTRALLQTPQVSKDFSLRSLVDHVQKHLRALRALKESVDSWDTILVLIIKDKLTNAIREKFEDISSDSKVSTMKELLEFLQRRAQFEDTKSPSSSEKSIKHDSKSGLKISPVQHAYVASNQGKPACYYCKGEHTMYKCDDFLKLTSADRLTEARRLTLCTNC